MKSFVAFILLMFLPLLWGKISAFITGDMVGLYAVMILPPLSPAPIVFPIVWVVLYLLMGFSSWLVYRRALKEQKSAEKYLFPYGVQLAVNFCWTPIFFGAEAYWLGALMSIVLFLTIIWMTIRFSKISKPAAWLQVPYMLWSLFAVYLSFGVAVLNP